MMMTPEHQRVFEVRADLAQGDGGLLRILIDAERYGLTLQSMTLRPGADHAADQSFTAAFAAPESPLDAAQLTSRLSRHVGVTGVECRDRARPPWLALAG